MKAGILLWRLVPLRFVRSAFSGEGAFQAGGRWNSAGTRIVYAAESRSLAAWEVLANIGTLSGFADLRPHLISVTVPPGDIEPATRVPASWRAYPFDLSARELGDAWARTRHSVALKVPSAVVRGEFNYLLNPDHPGFSRLAVSNPEKFDLDRRLAA